MGSEWMLVVGGVIIATGTATKMIIAAYRARIDNPDEDVEVKHVKRRGHSVEVIGHDDEEQ